MIESKDLDENIWAEDMNFYTNIHNNVPRSYIKWKIPFKLYTSHKPYVSNLMVLGSTAWARIPLDKRKYLEPQSVECIIIAYAK